MSACGAEAITGFIPLPTVEATTLGHEDNRNCKRSFICVHSIIICVHSKHKVMKNFAVYSSSRRRDEI